MDIYTIWCGHICVGINVTTSPSVATSEPLELCGLSSEINEIIFNNNKKHVTCCSRVLARYRPAGFLRTHHGLNMCRRVGEIYAWLAGLILFGWTACVRCL